ncbi:MAG: dihydropteroate synthase [Alphaproteobacteria bacterium]|nr:dihydropteroate synthase [Alphaproteobacteria bacterium]NDC55586.1 dihydropteroate synthase [Alphaproteobacteria bacterium]NDG04513.1 dihydropteroate synthase [Alphaproteobacteria bacterium]
MAPFNLKHWLAAHPGPQVMGIINITPDSFSGDGLMDSDGDAVQRAGQQARQMIEEGATMLDVGGASTRPGSAPIDAETEISRVVPVIQAIRALTNLPLSIDTSWGAVAEAALQAGATIVNDVWAMQHDATMTQVVARWQCPIILMHNRSSPQHVAGASYAPATYHDVVAEVRAEVLALAQRAEDVGILPENIILDPGIGFGKSVDDNLRLIKHARALTQGKYPLLYGLSRKSFIGNVLNVPPAQRDDATATLNALVALQGAKILRTHNVKKTAESLALVNAMTRV